MADKEEKLTLRQEKFCQAYVELDNASDAYRRAYTADNMSDNAIGVESCNLLKIPKISLRVEQLKHELLVQHQITAGGLIDMLKDAYKVAIDDGKGGQATAAVMGIAKICGLEKQVVEQTMTVKSGLDSFYANNESEKPNE